MTEKAHILVDTREQEPYSFSSQYCLTERRALPAGDYSLAGLEHAVAVERKTLEDFVGTVIRDRDRFRKELQKLSVYDRACIVVEAGLDGILSGIYRAGAHPNSVFGAALSIIVDYGIPVYFCSDRQCACRFTQEYLLRYLRRSFTLCQLQNPETSESGAESNASSSAAPTSVRDDS